MPLTYATYNTNTYTTYITYNTIRLLTLSPNNTNAYSAKQNITYIKIKCIENVLF